MNRRKVSELLAMEVLERLHQLDLVAAGERRSAAEVAPIRREMREMVAVWRSLLEGHRADGDGYCPRVSHRVASAAAVALRDVDRGPEESDPPPNGLADGVHRFAGRRCPRPR